MTTSTYDGPGSVDFDADSLLGVQEAASYLSITKATLYTWRSRRRGYGPLAVKVGGCVRYKKSELDRWIAAHTETAVDDPMVEESRRGRDPSPVAGRALTAGGRRE